MIEGRYLDRVTRGDALYIPFVAPSLQQTVPSAGIAVCLHSTVEFTCIAEDELRWREVGTPSVHLVTYMTSTGINQTGTTGVFRTVLTDISGNTLTSTAAIDSVSLSDDGRTVECRQTASSVITDLENTIQVEGNYFVVECADWGKPHTC